MNGHRALLSTQPTSRREVLARAGAGFGLWAMASTLGARSSIAASPEIGLHFPARAKRVIFLFMNGAPSHVDTFDPKPALAAHAGKKPAETHKKSAHGWLPSPFLFRRHGESGVLMSELFPHLSRHADDLCVLRSMHTDEPNHEPGLLMMNSGNRQPTRPSVGSWASYGLGTENENLPAFVVLCPGRPVVGPQLWSSAFLPGEHQGTALDTNDLRVEHMVKHLRHPTLDRAQQREQLDLLLALQREHQRRRPGEARLESQIRALELAFQMQAEASTAFDVSREPEKLRDEYGRTPFGQSCLMARRLCERGVRFVQVYYVLKGSKQPWDTHKDNEGGHRKLCADSDRATAALLADLKARGLLEDTLVVWGGEFGRTPYAQDRKRSPGRDHHHTGFSMFLAGGGVRGGLMHGTTDEFGMHAVEDRVHVHDLHATMLHLMGIDHEKLTYRYSGRDFRLTDVHGEVVSKILA